MTGNELPYYKPIQTVSIAKVGFGAVRNRTYRTWDV